MGRLADHATAHWSAGPAAIRLNVLFCQYLEFSRGDVVIATRPDTARRELLCGQKIELSNKRGRLAAHFAFLPRRRDSGLLFSNKARLVHVATHGGNGRGVFHDMYPRMVELICGDSLDRTRCNGIDWRPTASNQRGREFESLTLHHLYIVSSAERLPYKQDVGRSSPPFRKAAECTPPSDLWQLAAYLCAPYR
jgi:hypothetical protein